MKVVLIGAGRGRRLMPLTASEPKSFTPIAGKRILDWSLEAFRQNGLDRFVFIGGYLIDVVRRSYDAFEFVENANWPNGNILFSLLCARDHLGEGFYSTYTDTLFRPEAVGLLKDSPHDITLVMDTLWRDRYRYRSQHPEADGEKMIARDGVVTRISRQIPSEHATGEFTGILKMSAKGASAFLEVHDDLYASLGPEGLFTEGGPFRMAYLIHQLDYMVQKGIDIHCVAVPGEYHEIDTIEDYDLASREWGKEMGSKESISSGG